MEQQTKPAAQHPLPKQGNLRKPVVSKSNQVIGRIVAFVTVFCLLAALAVIRNGSLFGKDAESFFFFR